MAAISRPTAVAMTLAAVAFVAFVAWYRGAGPLTPAEVDHYMEAVSAQSAASRGRLDLHALRRFYEQDDGLPFFNVNLFKFRERARYQQPGPGTGLSGAAAFERYSAFMLRTLPSYASHIAFAGRGASGEAFDLIAVVRYRSRRDFAELHKSPDFAAHAVHKWAAIDRYEHYPVSSPGYLSSPYPWLLLLLGVLVFAAHQVDAWRRRRAGR